MTDFMSLYRRPPEVHASAPGRVNLIGEHTDYNGGFVLPTAIPQQTRVELARRPDRRVRAWSREEGGPEEYELGAEAAGRGWLDYVQGVTQAAARAGTPLTGFDVRIESDVPVGAGLSSSAALEVALLRALRAADVVAFDDVAIARLGQRAEHDLVGAPVGIMDPLAASLADPDHALFVDTRTLEVRRIPIPSDIELIVIASGITHAHAGGEYRIRRAQCEDAARRLGVRELRDLTESDLERAMLLPEPLGRRVRHVVTENLRVLAAVLALEACDLPALGALFEASHRSMRDDYEVSVPQIDTLVEIAARDPDVVGARMTGGGFGGSIVALARRGAATIAAPRIAATYQDCVGERPRILVPPPEERSP